MINLRSEDELCIRNVKYVFDNCETNKLLNARHIRMQNYIGKC